MTCFGAHSAGAIQYRHQYLDMSSQVVEASNWTRAGRTCPASMGFSFAAGTTDGVVQCQDACLTSVAAWSRFHVCSSGRETGRLVNSHTPAPSLKEHHITRRLGVCCLLDCFKILSILSAGPGAFDFTQGDTNGTTFWRIVRDFLHVPTTEQVLLPVC